MCCPGIVLLAKNAAKAKALSLCIGASDSHRRLLSRRCQRILTEVRSLTLLRRYQAERQASKTYLARGRGCFPTELTPDAKQLLVQTAQEKCPASAITFTDANELVISCPLRCVSAREGVYECHAEGKPSETVVSLMRNGSTTCLFKCKPVTGRTHQIRLHLQLIGFPIANDPCYGGQLHFGESQARLDEIELATRAKEQLPPKRDGDFSTPQQEGETEDEFMQRTCSWCYVGADEAFNETQLHCSKIWLHALEYEVRHDWDGQASVRSIRFDGW